MKPDGERIGVFGGTFDPVHAGHVAMVEAARNAASLDRILVIPCWISPHKLQEAPPTPGDLRAEMCRIAFRRHPWVEIDERELQRGGVSFSWETAADVRLAHPNARLYWILGTDQWLALPNWKHPERLAAEVDFIVIGRDGSAFRPRNDFRAEFVESVHPASSTRIRQAFAEGAMTHPWVDPKVGEWITSRGLYRTR